MHWYHHCCGHVQAQVSLQAYVQLQPSVSGSNPGSCPTRRSGPVRRSSTSPSGATPSSWEIGVGEGVWWLVQAKWRLKGGSKWLGVNVALRETLWRRYLCISIYSRSTITYILYEQPDSVFPHRNDWITIGSYETCCTSVQIRKIYLTRSKAVISVVKTCLSTEHMFIGLIEFLNTFLKWLNMS